MKKRFLLSLILIFGLCSCTTSNKTKENQNDLDVKNVLDKFIDDSKNGIPSWNKESFKGRWNYIDGLFLKSCVSMYKFTNDTTYIEFVKNYTSYYLDNDGKFINIKDNSSSGYNVTELDSVCESYVLFDLYDYTNNKKYVNAINYTYSSLIDMPICKNSVCYSHKTTYLNQIWLDGFYMYAPFLVRYNKMNNLSNTSLYRQYEYVYENMKDKDKGLYYHGLDTTKTIFWANKSTGLSENFWLRSNGYLLASLMEVIPYFEGSEKAFLSNMAKELSYSLERSSIKGEHGLYMQLIDKGNISKNVSYDSYLKYLNKAYTKDTVLSNYEETSGNSLIAYAYLLGVENNILDIKYKDIANDILDKIIKYYYIDSNLTNICITAGLGPYNKVYRDGSIDYYLAEARGNNDAKGLGPFIMALIEKQYMA